MNNTKKTTITITLELTESTANDLKNLMTHMRDEPTLAGAALKALEQGISSMAYRYERNAKVWQKLKEEKAELAMLRAKMAGESK